MSKKITNAFVKIISHIYCLGRYKKNVQQSKIITHWSIVMNFVDSLVNFIHMTNSLLECCAFNWPIL